MMSDIARTYNSSVGGRSVATMSCEKPFKNLRVHHEVSTSRECHVTTSVDVLSRVRSLLA